MAIKDVKISGVEDARKFEPKPNTLMVRIYAPCLSREYPPLDNEKDYLRVLNYSFDDIDLFSATEFKKAIGRKLTPLDRTLAEKMLKEFEEVYEKADHLYVHCHKGKRRSPAVALAYNDIFSLELNPANIMRAHPAYNRFVHAILFSTARDLKLVEY